MYVHRSKALTYLRYYSVNQGEPLNIFSKNVYIPHNGCKYSLMLGYQMIGETEERILGRKIF